MHPSGLRVAVATVLAVTLLLHLVASSALPRFAEEVDSNPHARDLYMRNYINVLYAGRCRTPQPRVVRVLDVFPSDDKWYSPSCTILHRCASDTGCCEAGSVCGPSKTEPVTVYFKAITYHAESEDVFRVNMEAITFENHTRCSCHSRLNIPTDEFQSYR